MPYPITIFQKGHLTTNNKQQTTNNKQQTTNNKQQTTNNKLYLDNQYYSIAYGNWAFYIKDIQLKLFHTANSFLHCYHESAPDREAVEQADSKVLKNDTYSINEWQAAYTKKVTRRAAENFIAAKRLHEAGLGPKPTGLCLVMHYTSDTFPNECMNAGIFIENLDNYPRRAPVTLEEMISAGVKPDKIKSAIRQQINGYVSDLNSVVGVMPITAEKEIYEIESLLIKKVNNS